MLHSRLFPFLSALENPGRPNLTHSAVYPFIHWSLRLVLVGMVDALALVLLFNGGCARLKCRQVHRISVHQLLGDSDDVGNEPIEQVQRHALAYNDAQNLRLLFLWRKRIVRDDVLLGTQESADALLLHVAVVLFKGIRQVESNNWKSRNVVCTGQSLFIDPVLDLTMNIGNAGIWITVSESAKCYRKCILSAEHVHEAEALRLYLEFLLLDVGSTYTSRLLQDYDIQKSVLIYQKIDLRE